MPCPCKQCRSGSVDFFDLYLVCLSSSMWICINNLDHVIWLAENFKWAWHLNLFSMTMVNFTTLRSNSVDDKLTFSQKNRTWYFNPYHSLGKFIRWQTEDIFFYFLPNRRQSAWNIKTYFLWKIEKYVKMSSAEIFTQHAKHFNWLVSQWQNSR